MTIARMYQIDLTSTLYYHCVSRCVRRMFLNGKDYLTGKDYSHRKKWIVDRMKFLTNIFAINICSYAVMSNHTHLVLHINIEAAKLWTNDEVCRRWELLYPKDYAAFKRLRTQGLSSELIDQKISQWRVRIITHREHQLLSIVNSNYYEA